SNGGRGEALSRRVKSSKRTFYEVIKIGRIVKGMKLTQIVEHLNDFDMRGHLELEINGLTYDSRLVRPGYLFVALRGHQKDGHDYLPDAVARGAAALVAEDFLDIREDIPKIRVPDSREALSKMAAQFYQHPYSNLNLIGITGTNGKTTTSYVLESILSAAGKRPGIIGTINYHFKGNALPAPVTTPESLDLMHILRKMADGDVSDVIMEVSSHALDQGRTNDCPFKLAIFTNFSRDHLDYHHTMEEYFAAKSLLFQGLQKRVQGKKTAAIINMDDPRGRALASLTAADVITYGLGSDCQVRANAIDMSKRGLRARLITPEGEKDIQSSLIGEINIYNILAATAAALSLNIDLSVITAGIKRLKAVPGRMERVPNGAGLSIVVDYAHTPDALSKTIKALRPLTDKKLITIFGCGGDRDQGKRHVMGHIAAANSDVVIITSDNPRSEDPVAIIEQVEKGAQESGLTKLTGPVSAQTNGRGYLIEADRRVAIRKAVELAKKSDLILIAGKGHENYQIVGDKTRHFDDREEAARAVAEVRP
ncbi:UDP-N-acetylmuramoyl-L-alanyl-D-glutamate--2,6-diaminopimelate ligase, partial [Thermodesulfobacteriota bacterium]